MTLDRREFLVRAGLAAGAAALATGASTGCGGTAAAKPVAPPSAWDAIRKEFLLAPDWIHLATFFIASHPRVVREAIERHRRALDDNPFFYIEEHVARFETDVRAAVAEYLGAGVDDVAMTDSTTMGLGSVYGGLALGPGDDILTTTHDHIVTHVALQNGARRHGAKVRRIPLYDQPERAGVEEIVDRFVRAILPATRVAAVTWVHSGTGVKLPIQRLAEAVARTNASRPPERRVFLMVDGVHGIGNQDLTIATSGVDVFIAGCHKWLFGPRGTGFVWARPEAWAITTPTIPTMDPMWRPGGLERIPPAAWMTPGGFHSFEHRWALAEAVRWHGELGRARIAARVAELNTRAKAELAGVRRVRVRTPASSDLSAGIICFEVDGVAPKEVVERLKARRIVASVTPDFYEPPYVRYAPSLLNDEEQISTAVRALAEI